MIKRQRNVARTNITDVVYNIIQKRPEKGFAPFEILRQPEAQDIHASSFPYLQLHRLKTRGEIIARDGRYYPTPTLHCENC